MREHPSSNPTVGSYFQDALQLSVTNFCVRKRRCSHNNVKIKVSLMEQNRGVLLKHVSVFEGLGIKEVTVTQ